MSTLVTTLKDLHKFYDEQMFVPVLFYDVVVEKFDSLSLAQRVIKKLISVCSSGEDISTIIITDKDINPNVLSQIGRLISAAFNTVEIYQQQPQINTEQQRVVDKNTFTFDKDSKQIIINILHIVKKNIVSFNKDRKQNAVSFDVENSTVKKSTSKLKTK